MPQEMFSQPVAQTCPECGGAMREENAGSLTLFRCHIGHVMTAEVLAATQLERLENEFSTVLRSLHERAALCREIATKRVVKDDKSGAELWEQAAAQAEQRQAMAIKLVDAGWLHPEIPGPK